MNVHSATRRWARGRGGGRGAWSRKRRSGGDRVPDALLGELPLRRVGDLAALEPGADHADERAEDEAHEQARRSGAELAPGLRAGHDVRDQVEHSLLHRAAFGVEVISVVMQLEE